MPCICHPPGWLHVAEKDDDFARRGLRLKDMLQYGFLFENTTKKWYAPETSSAERVCCVPPESRPHGSPGRYYDPVPSLYSKRFSCRDASHRQAPPTPRLIDCILIAY